jgi:PAS domain S-box-containing protein
MNTRRTAILPAGSRNIRRAGKPADDVELRHRAEERLAEQRKSQKSEAGDPGTAEDTARLVHELQVHQIELEMQNEELQQAHAQVETLLAQYTDLYDLAPAGYLTFDREGAIRQVNLAGARLFGVERSRLVNRRFGLFVAERDQRAFSDFLQKVFASQAKECCEVTLPKESSQLVVVQIEGTRSADGQECRAVVVDLTERKRAEVALIRLAAIVESSDDAIIGTDRNSSTLSWNKGAVKIFGYTASEMVGTSIMRLIPADRQDEEGQIMEKIKRGESMNHFETLRQTKDGRLIDVSITASPIRDATGMIIGVSKVARDITERRKLEAQFRQAQKMEAFGQLAGGVAHDFNNILAVIQMQSGLLKTGGNLSPEHLESAEEIGAAAQRAAVLTRQLLLFSRKEILQLRDLDLNQSINDMVKMLRRTLGEDIQLQFKFAMQSLFIRADAGMIDQVLMNLAVNARDAMPKGGQFIIETSAVDFDESVHAQSARAGSGSLVCLSVSDTGCGIPPEILPRIFEPFFTTKDVGKGTGLGLATVFGIVGQHQGWINVHSEVGHGTTFHIYLPQLTKISRQKPERPTLTSMRGGNETILLVEDDAFLRASVRKTLSRLGYRVIEAINGIEALKVWKQNCDGIHLLLTDLVMPGGMTGKDLGKRLLKENPRLKVIYASGYSAKAADGNFPLEDGVNFLTKPFNAQKLAQTVRQNLDANI